MAHLSETVFQALEQLALSAAFQHFGDEGAVCGQNNLGDIERRRTERHDTDMIGAGMACRRRRHIAQHEIRLSAQRRLHGRQRLHIERIQLQFAHSRQRFQFRHIDGDDDGARRAAGCPKPCLA